ncbi:hypothetical protein M9H77_23055 [Catharanthus roseus]|uniref:Uncharacterized protein n=1 Tax=Catharanthus roseus TaxID=4058 RepID=A0ACC0ARV0_CATRO|nr:hypothetical protein M9H77_23055 [Catharanthus roseus]
MEEVPTHVHPRPIVTSEERTVGSRDPANFIWLSYLNRALLRRNDHTYWGTKHASHIEAWYQWRLRVRDGPVIATETSMLQEVDDMTSMVIQQPPTDPS